MNWENSTENLVVSILAFFAGAFTCYLVMSKTVESTTTLILEKNNEVIMTALKRETTSIKNEFKTEIKKLKNRKGELTLDVKPIIENQINQKEVNTNIQDTIPEPEEKKGWLGRLFSKKNNNKNQ
jgi:hypothetical protein